MRTKQLLIVAAALLLFAAMIDDAAAVDRTCMYDMRVKAENPLIASFKIRQGDMTVKGWYHSTFQINSQSDERLAREAAGEGAERCARAAWTSDRKPAACRDRQIVDPGAGRALVERWAINDLSSTVINSLCGAAYGMGIDRDVHLRNVSVYLYKTDNSDDTSSCSFGLGDHQSRYFEIATHFAVDCVTFAIPTEIHGRWSEWHNETLAALEQRIRNRCRSSYGFEHVVIEETERNPRTGAVRARFGCAAFPLR